MAATAQRVMEILITVGVIWIGLYVIEGTFGIAMSDLFVQFGNSLSFIHLSAGWNAVCTNELNQWPQFYNGITAMILTVGVWGFKGIFISDTSSRYRG